MYRVPSPPPLITVLRFIFEYYFFLPQDSNPIYFFLEQKGKVTLIQKMEVSSSFQEDSRSRRVHVSSHASSLPDEERNDGIVDPPPLRVFGEVVLRMQGIKKSYLINSGKESVVALQEINLNEHSEFHPVRKGEFVMIRGPSGGGKTTLLNLVGTIDSPTTGTLELLGQRIDEHSSDDFLSGLRLRNIGFVFQTFNLLATMSAVENVELPMTLLGVLSERDRKRRAKQLLSLVGLRNRVDHLPSELSGGEQQRVTIARALANNPSILLLDEPTGDLDTQTTLEVMDLLLRLNHLVGTTCMMVTHNPDLECYADRILYVSDGKFVKEAVNSCPMPLEYEAYQRYLAEKDEKLTRHVKHPDVLSSVVRREDDI